MRSLEPLDILTTQSRAVGEIRERRLLEVQPGGVCNGRPVPRVVLLRVQDGGCGED